MLKRQPTVAVREVIYEIASQEELAIEGYQVTGEETLAFADAAWKLVGELDWVWDEAS